MLSTCLIAFKRYANKKMDLSDNQVEMFINVYKCLYNYSITAER